MGLIEGLVVIVVVAAIAGLVDRLIGRFGRRWSGTNRPPWSTR